MIPVFEVMPSPEDETSPVCGQIQGVYSALNRRELLLLTIAGLVWMLINGAYLVLLSFGPVFLSEQGTSFAAAGRVVSLMSWVFLFSLPLGGYLATRYRAPNVVMFSGLFGIAARLGTERATERQRETILAAIEQLADPTLGHEDQFERLHDLGDLFLEAAGNMVLKLVRRGLHTQLLNRIERRHSFEVSPPAALRVPPLRLLADAVRAVDGAAATEASHELTVALRGHVAATLSAAHAAAGDGGRA